MERERGGREEGEGGEGVRRKEEGVSVDGSSFVVACGEEVQGVGSSEEGVSAESSSSIVACGDTESRRCPPHLPLTPFSLLLCPAPFSLLLENVGTDPGGVKSDAKRRRGFIGLRTGWKGACGVRRSARCSCSIAKFAYPWGVSAASGRRVRKSGIRVRGDGQLLADAEFWYTTRFRAHKRGGRGRKPRTQTNERKRRRWRLESLRLLRRSPRRWPTS